MAAASQDFDTTELKNLLLEFTVCAMVEKPDDIVSYAAEYFTEKLQKRNTGDNNDPSKVQRVCPRDKGDPLKAVDRKTDKERARIRKLLQGNDLFQTLDDIQMDQVMEHMVPRRANAKEVLIRVGDPGDFFYVVEKGRFEVYGADDPGMKTPLKVYKDHGVFGELALMESGRRQATVQCIEGGLLWTLGARAFRRYLRDAIKKKRDKYRILLGSSPIFQDVDGYVVSLLCDAVKTKYYQPGEFIVYTGDLGRGLYFVVSGIVESTIREVDETNEVIIIPPGDYFGDLESSEIHPTLVKARTEAELAFLSPQAIDKVLPARPVVAIRRHKGTMRHKSLSEAPLLSKTPKPS